MEGTSFAAPQGAAAAAVLAGSGISYPAAQKAILVNSARLGRATPASPMGTQTAWQPDWGWGAIDLGAAVGQRANFHAGSVEGGGARFYRSVPAGAGERATLVWHRRAVGCQNQPGCVPHAMTLTNLDLKEIDPATGAVLAESSSAIDNVEQVRAGGAGEVIYKVEAASTVDGLAAEPYAIASRRPLTPLATPRPTVDMRLGASAPVRPGDEVTVEARVANPSADLTAEDVQVTLQLPAGVELVSGAQTQSFGTLSNANGERVASWTLRGTTDGLATIAARATATRYGTTFAASDVDTVSLDGSGPAMTLAAPGGVSEDAGLRISWGASDPSGVRAYDVEVSLNGGPFVPWIAGSSATSATYVGAAGNRYVFRARAVDTLGNASQWVLSPEVEIVPPRGSGGSDPGSGDSASKSPARLSLVRIRRTRSALVVRGTMAGAATGRVRAVFATRLGKRRVRIRASRQVSGGRFRLSLRLRGRARGARNGMLRVSYAGDSRFLPETRKVRVRASR
jgi:hypothetical protein